MGTNYYLQKECCSRCGRSDEPMHIGKSSSGWVFALHVDPENGPRDLAEWRALWAMPNTKIVDEYGNDIAPADMLSHITERSHPHGLCRSHVDGKHCIANGEGTYDLFRGEFA